MSKIRTLVLHLLFLLLVLGFRNNSSASAAVPVEVRVGVVLDMNSGAGQMGLSCIRKALSDFYATHGNYRTRLALYPRDTNGDVILAAAAVVDLLKNVKVQAIIGPHSSMEAHFVISLGEKAHVPIITFSSTSPFLASMQSQYFFRTALSDSSQVPVIAGIIKAFEWREVVPILVDNEFGHGIMPHLADALEEIYVRVPYRSVIPPSASDDQVAVELYKLMSMETRVFIVHMAGPLASRVFLKAEELGMMSEGYAWIITDAVANTLSSMNSSEMEFMVGVLGVRPHVPKKDKLGKFQAWYNYHQLLDNASSQNHELSIYGLWAYDTATALAMAVEKIVGVGDAVFSVQNASTNATDLEAFGISSVGLDLAYTMSNTTFRGIAGHFELVDRQLRSPPYEVINIAEQGAQVVGYWTSEMGIARRLKGSKTKFRPIIWPGDTSSRPKGWVLPINGKKLRILVPDKPVFTQFIHVTYNSDNTTSVQGFCPDVFDAVVKALPYALSYEYISFPINDDSYDDMVRQVSIGNYDALVGDVTITADRSQYVDFTLPYTESGVSMIVPYDKKDFDQTWVFLRPLTWKLWLTTLFSFLFMGVVIWILEHRINDDFRGPFLHQVGLIYWFAFSTMVFAQRERIFSNSSRAVLIIWFFLVLILAQSYTASLSSLMTVHQLKPTITDINTLIQKDEFVGYQAGSFVYDLLKRMNFRESRLRPFNMTQQLVEMFEKGSGNGGIAAAFDETPYLRSFIAEYCQKYTMVGPVYRTAGFGFVFPIGSPLVSDISRAILNVIESDKMTQIVNKWNDTNGCSGTPASSTGLGLESFWVLFAIAGIAAALALFNYFGRFLYQHHNVLRRSDSNSQLWQRVRDLLRIFNDMDPNSHAPKTGAGECECRRKMELETMVPFQPPTSTPCSTSFSSPGEESLDFFSAEEESQLPEASSLRLYNLEGGLRSLSI